MTTTNGNMHLTMPIDVAIHHVAEYNMRVKVFAADEDSPGFVVLQLGEPSGRLTLYFDHMTELANWGRWITAEAERLKHENTRQAGGFDVVA